MFARVCVPSARLTSHLVLNEGMAARRVLLRTSVRSVATSGRQGNKRSASGPPMGIKSRKGGGARKGASGPRRGEGNAKGPLADALENQQPTGWFQKRRLAKQEEMTGAQQESVASTAPRQAAQGRQTKNVRKGKKKRRRNATQADASQTVRKILIPQEISVRDLAASMSLKADNLVKTLERELGERVESLDQALQADVAELVVSAFPGLEAVHAPSFQDVKRATKPSDPSLLVPRPPVVTVMGHVDHGKTTLLDALRNSSVAAHEAGGITQHIGAFTVHLDQFATPVTFLDTPGHVAFSEMRARGANVTDLVILVVAAEDSIMPQTVEAINHAKAANVPLVVAINKCDKEGANPDRTRQDLLAHGVVTEQYDGDTLSCQISALKGEGLDELLMSIQLMADAADLRADPTANPEAVIIESRTDKGRGVVCTALVRVGTLNKGQYFVVGEEWGKVRTMTSDDGVALDAAGPSSAVELTGVRGNPPVAGEDLIVVDSEERAKSVVEYRRLKRESEEQRVLFEQSTAASSSGGSQQGSLVSSESDAEGNEIKVLPCIVKCDVHGTMQALLNALAKFPQDEVTVKVIHSSVGNISESDVMLASASKALVLGFNVNQTGTVAAMAKEKDVRVSSHRVIYELLDDVKAHMSGLLDPEYEPQVHARASVHQVFPLRTRRSAEPAVVAGCRVVEGNLNKKWLVRVVRDGSVVAEGLRVTSLRHFKDEVDTVNKGQECGVMLGEHTMFEDGDALEFYSLERVDRSIDDSAVRN